MSRRRGVGVAVVLVGAVVLLLAGPGPAAACSCLAVPGEEPEELPIVFEGTALEQVEHPVQTGDTRWRFAVDRVGRGDVDDPVVVDLMVDLPPKDGLAIVSSCSVGDAPTIGDRYRVGAAIGEDGVPYAGFCGGYLIALDGSSDLPPLPGDEETPIVPSVVAGASIAAVGGAALAVAVRHRREPAPT